MRKVVKIFIVLVLTALASTFIVGCNEKNKTSYAERNYAKLGTGFNEQKNGHPFHGLDTSQYKDCSWYTENYVQGQYGNVPKLSSDNKTAEGYKEGAEIDFKFNKVNGARKPFITAWYFEVNDVSILNAKTLTIGNTGVPLTDIVIIFAANINWDSVNNRPILHLNGNVDATLVGYKKYIKPLQDLGIKVVLDILPNHQGIGFDNLTPEDAEIFAEQLVQCVDKFGLDGIDFDEEYADYRHLSSIRPQRTSGFINLLVRLRERMPDKLLTMFDYNVPDCLYSNADYLKERNVINFAFANYGSRSNAYYVKDKRNLSYSSTELNRSGVPSYQKFKQMAQNAINEDAGTLMFFCPFRINGGSQYASEMTGLTEVAYGEKVIFSGRKYLQDWK